MTRATEFLHFQHSILNLDGLLVGLGLAVVLGLGGLVTKGVLGSGGTDILVSKMLRLRLARELTGCRGMR